jgi:Asp-tRNA(Asn)/Glu-tRNA(Gln) amidotransferase A subunit family amidase
VTDLDALTIARARDLLRDGKLSAVELLEATLRRIEETEPLVHAYVHLMAESALAAARQADAHRPRNPLHGSPSGSRTCW